MKKPRGKRPYVNGGKVNMYPYGNEWLINLYALQEYSITLSGKTPKQIIPHIDSEDAKAASVKNLLEEWKPKSAIDDPFSDPDYDSSHLQAYAILTMCRILHSIKKGAFATKKSASEWVKRTYGNRWNYLIDEAQQWKHGKTMNRKEEAKAFIAFTIQEAINS